MQISRAKRFPIWAFAGSGLLIGIPLLLFCVYQIIRSVETRRWAEMRRWCEDVAREVRARDTRRPVLRGEAVEGNAWDDYRVALDTLGSKLDVSPITNVLSRQPSADRGGCGAAGRGLHSGPLTQVRRNHGATGRSAECGELT